MEKTKQVELLSPAGSFDTLKAVIEAGADAVYAGGSRFGARAYADNFTKEQLLDAIDHAHLYGKKLYLTVNTLLKQDEMEQLYDYLLPYYEQGLDAVIVQDLGVLQLVRACFPDLAVHASTQMSITDVYGAAYLKSFGVSRIVTARELSLAEIRAIKKQVSVEIESFVHGALCYCYSGQCLLSSMLGGRSGNRGRCAQPCRLPYTVLDRTKKAVLAEDCYPLSPKDLCTADMTAQLAEAGIDSFKIEGRMKSAQYAAEVTAVYRKYLDQYLESGAAAVQKQDYQRLLDAGNRSGFTQGYYRQRNGRDMIAMARPAYQKKQDAPVFAASRQSRQKLNVHARACFKTGCPPVLTVSCGGVEASAQYGMTQAAEKQPMSRSMLAQQLSKTGNTPFQMESITITMDDAVFLPKQTLNELRRQALERLYGRLTGRWRRKAAEDARNRRPPQKQTDMPKSNGFGLQTACHAAGRNIRPPYYAAVVEEAAQLDPVLACGYISRIYLDSTMYTHSGFQAQLKKDASRIRNAKKQAYLSLPPVFRTDAAEFYKKQLPHIEQAGVNGYLAKSLDELGFLKEMRIDGKRCVLDHSLYTYSDDAKNVYAAAGWEYDTIPLELNKKELRRRNNQKSELVIYGRMPLMTSAQCVFKTLGRCGGIRDLCYLKDRYDRQFPVRNNCSECHSVLYNALPLSLLQLSGELPKLHPAGYRLWFTIETPQETAEILAGFCEAFFSHRIPDMAQMIGAYTNGHYKRGTE